MKDLQYITHDLGARNDPKLLSLQMEMGGQGLAIFWCLVEMLWENDGEMPMDFRAIAFSLRWATAEEVERVIRDFGLFLDNGTSFWSRSALERIAQKKDRIKATSEARRNAANVRWQNASNANAMQMQCNSNAGAMQTDANKDINKDINKKRDSNNILEPPTAAEISDYFLLEMNFKDPVGEAERFLEHYSRTEWTYQDGTPVTDIYRCAGKWKPAKAGKRFDTEVLNWYRAIYAAALPRMKDARKVFVCALSGLRRKDQAVSIIFKTREDAEAAAAFIRGNDLAGDWNIEFRFNN